jgi:hypothetical protein
MLRLDLGVYRPRFAAVTVAPGSGVIKESRVPLRMREADRHLQPKKAVSQAKSEEGANGKG